MTTRVEAQSIAFRCAQRATDDFQMRVAELGDLPEDVMDELEGDIGDAMVAILSKVEWE